MGNPSRTPSAFDRRAFIKVSSFALAGVAGAGLPSSLFAAQPVSPVSIGFSPEMPAAGKAVRLSAANAMLTGDPSFLSRDARVTVSSSARISASGSESVAMDVVFPALGEQARSFPTYRAWSCAADNNPHHESRRVSFRTPIDGTNGLQLQFVRGKAAENGTKKNVNTTDTILLGLGSTAGTPKLQRGLYVIAYDGTGANAAPDWSSRMVVNETRGFAVQNAQFSYVVLTIDYAL